MREIDKDGYEIVPAMPTATKGVKCGQCGAKFDHGKAYGFYCSRNRCPMGFVGIISGGTNTGDTP